MAVIAIVGEGLMRPRRCARWTMEIPISKSGGTVRAEGPCHKPRAERRGSGGVLRARRHNMQACQTEERVRSHERPIACRIRRRVDRRGPRPRSA